MMIEVIAVVPGRVVSEAAQNASEIGRDFLVVWDGACWDVRLKSPYGNITLPHRLAVTASASGPIFIHPDFVVGP